MKTGLLFKNRVYTPRNLDFYERDLFSDLELQEIIKAGSLNDEYMADVFTHVIFDMLTNKEDIIYRQNILKDAIENEQFFRDIYYFVALLSNELKREFRFGIREDSPSGIMWTSHTMLGFIAGRCDAYRNLLGKKNTCQSEGMLEFIKDAVEQFSSSNVNRLLSVYEDLNSDKGTMMSVTLDGLLRETKYVLCKSNFFDRDGKRRWKKAERMNFPVMTESLIAEINQKIDYAAYNISESMGRAVQAICDYFEQVRYEMAFYICSMNLIKGLSKLGCSYTFPFVIEERNFSYEGLYDAALSLKAKKPAVSNTHTIGNKKIRIITGANQGGKTTYLRSLGQSILLAQAGTIVPADSFSFYTYPSLYGHFDREEDQSMESGKFDDEIKRLSALVDHMKRGSCILFNEPFQSTNEHEGSTIGTGILRALLDEEMDVVLVTHMFELSENLMTYYPLDTYYLRAVRVEDGKRAFTLEEAKPLETSFAMDLYKKIFEEK